MTLWTQREVFSRELLHERMSIQVGEFRFGLIQQLAAEREQFFLAAVGPEAEVADPHEVGREQMQEEAADKLHRVEFRFFALVMVSTISILKADLPG